MKHTAIHALAVMLLAAAAFAQQKPDTSLSSSLSEAVEKAQALDKEAQRVCKAIPIQMNWDSAKRNVQSAEQFEMKRSSVLTLIPVSVMFVRHVLMADALDCGQGHQSLTLKLQSATWDLDNAEQKLLQQRLLNTLLMDEIQAKQKEH